MDAHSERAKQAAEQREAFWRTIGTPGPSFAPLIGPALLGGPEWPTRPAWRVLHRPDGHTAFVSDGLSDPWEDRPGPSFGMELIVETPDPIGETPGSWAMALLVAASNTVAGHGGVLALLEREGVVSLEVDGAGFPEALRGPDGEVGALLGIAHPSLPAAFALPEGTARLVAVTVLSPAELDRARAEGAPGRRAIVAARPDHRSRVASPAVAAPAAVERSAPTRALGGLLPVLALRGSATHVPGPVPVEIGAASPAAVGALATAIDGDGRVVLAAALDPRRDTLDPANVARIGVEAAIVRHEWDAGRIRARVVVLAPVRLGELARDERALVATATVLPWERDLTEEDVATLGDLFAREHGGADPYALLAELARTRIPVREATRLLEGGSARAVLASCRG